MTQEILRQVSALACTLAFAGLLWRLVGRWTFNHRLGKIVLALFAALELVVALGAARAAALDHPFNEVQYLILVHATMTLTVVALWPHIHRIGHPDA